MEQDSSINESKNDAVETALVTLQPIRDLAKNWDIDIASCLEEYLNELVSHVPIQDRQQLAQNENLNFAQAALVLQNSSNIYSRKVEYLYTLVYRALDELGAVDNNHAANKRQRGAVDEVDEFENFDPHVEFLLLDDVLPVDDTEDCTKINLRIIDDDDEDDVGRFSNRSMTRLSLGMNNTSTQSISAVQAKAHRALIGSLDTGSSLRLVDGRCDVVDSGCLLMPGTTLHEALPQETAQPQHENQDDDNDFGGMDGGQAFDDDDHDNDGAGFAFAEDDNEPPSSEHVQEEASKRVTFAASITEKPNRSVADPWQLLDPHTPDTTKSRPLKIGKTLQLPTSVHQLPSDCVTGARTKVTTRYVEDAPSQPTSKSSTTSLATATFAALRKRSHHETTEDDDESFTESLPSVPLSGLVFGEEFAYIAKATAKRKAAERRERRKQRAQAAAASEPMEDDEDDVGFGMGYYGDDNDHDFGDGGGAFDDDEDPLQSNTGMASVDEVYQNRDNADDSNADARTFEELCRAHISKFRRGAERFASETHLSKRVGHWQDKLVPLLEQEEQRPVFDIDNYGQDVLTSLEREIESRTEDSDDEDNVKTVPFSMVTRDQPSYQVCRLFLAALSLSNSGNVHLSVDQDDDTLTLELLHSTMERPMETYLAPSAVEMATASVS